MRESVNSFLEVTSPVNVLLASPEIDAKRTSMNVTPILVRMQAFVLMELETFPADAFLVLLVHSVKRTSMSVVQTPVLMVHIARMVLLNIPVIVSMASQE